MSRMAMPNTYQQYQNVTDRCRELFKKKTADYGTSWRILRLPSITDQLFIKARRIRSLQEKGFGKVNEGQLDEFIGLVNYAIIALMQIELPPVKGEPDMPIDQAVDAYNAQVNRNLDLLKNKNHDYDEAWREMRISSITDIILMKLYRIKQIEDNNGVTQVSEGVEGGYRDILNYSVFCLIQLGYDQA